MQCSSKLTGRQSPCLKKGFSSRHRTYKSSLELKLHAVCEAGGQSGPAASDSRSISGFKKADAFLVDLPEGREEVIVDWGYDSNYIRRSLADRENVRKA